MRRQRRVVIEAQRGGKLCNATDTAEVVRCNTDPCHPPTFCTWAKWAPWETCSVSCGGGQRKRQRTLVGTLGALPPPSSSLSVQALTEEAAVEARGVDPPGGGGDGAASWSSRVLLQHQAQLCGLAAVGAVSLLWMFVSGLRQATAHAPRLAGPGQETPYRLLATEDPMTDGEEEQYSASASRVELAEQC